MIGYPWLMLLVILIKLVELIVGILVNVSNDNIVKFGETRCRKILFNTLHPEKTLDPIFVTLLGIIILDKFVQFWNV